VPAPRRSAPSAGALPADAAEDFAARLAQSERTRILNLQDLRLDRFPHAVERWLALHDLDLLNLSRNALGDLPPSLGQLTSLKTLVLSRNGLRALPDLSGLGTLRHLDLGVNRITWLPETLYALTALESLLVPCNLLSALDSARLSGLARLRTVDLASNRFAEVPRELLALPVLASLIVDGNPLVRLPDRFATNRSLRSLSAVRCGVRSFPESLCRKCRALETLNLSDNRLAMIEGDMRDVGLLDLNLSGNVFRVIPTSLCFISSLTALNLARNRIASVPGDIRNLSEQLASLDLSKNRIGSLSSAIGSLTTLCSLNISSNRFRVVPRELAQLEYL
ncbi:MAG TPA: hypothetical protein VJB16_05345, partial [archaeon]|nr:hypothetical protein [archaeon]